MSLIEGAEDEVIDKGVSRKAYGSSELMMMEVQKKGIEAHNNSSILIQGLIHNKAVFPKLVEDEAIELKTKFSTQRRSALEDTESGQLDEIDVIPNEEILLAFSEKGYMKRMKPDTLCLQNRGTIGKSVGKLRVNDTMSDYLVCRAHDHVLYFSNMGSVYSARAYIIPECTSAAAGTPLIQILSLSQGERITSIIPVSEFSGDQYLLMSTVNGYTKKVSLSSFSSIRSTGIIAIQLLPGDELKWVRRCTDDDLVAVASQNGMVNLSGGEKVIMQSDTILELARTSQTLSTLQDEASLLLKFADSLKIENAVAPAPVLSQSFTAVIALKIRDDLFFGVESKVSGPDAPYADHDKIFWLTPSVAVIGSGSRDLFDKMREVCANYNFNPLENMDQISNIVKKLVEITTVDNRYPYDRHKLVLTIVGDHGIGGVDAKIQVVARENDTSVRKTTHDLGVMTGSGAEVMTKFQEEGNNGFDGSIRANDNEQHRIYYGKKFVLNNMIHATKMKSDSCGGPIQLVHIPVRAKRPPTLDYYTVRANVYELSRQFMVLPKMMPLMPQQFVLLPHLQMMPQPQH